MAKSRSGNAPIAIPIAGHMPRIKFGAGGFPMPAPKPKAPPGPKEGAPVGSFKPGTEARVKVEPCKPEVKW